MHFFKTFQLKILAVCIFHLAAVEGQELLVRSSTGHQLIFEINPEESFCEVFEKIHIHLADLKEEDQVFISLPGLLKFCLDDKLGLAGLSKAAQKEWRNYHAQVTQEETDLITYIISTLGNKSLTKVWKEKGSLKKAGDQIDHLHPLQFLRVVFTDETLKACMANIRDNRWVWNEFKKGLFNSLKDESKNNNMTLEYIIDFSQAVEIDHQLILPPIQQSDWDKFITTLIKKVPREGNSDRYDM
jgi:hypothetical protein